MRAEASEPMADPHLQSHDAAPEVQMLPGVFRRTLNHGDRTSIHEIRIDQGAVVPDHTHPHEQTGYLVSGRMRFEMPGLVRELAPGDSWLVPGDIPHSVTALSDVIALDVFSPVREEYLD